MLTAGDYMNNTRYRTRASEHWEALLHVIFTSDRRLGEVEASGKH